MGGGSQARNHRAGFCNLSMTDDELQEFLAERDAMLRALDPERAIAYYKKYNPGKSVPEGEILMISLHKARTACLSLTREERLESQHWLAERGYGSLDDGDLSN